MATTGESFVSDMNSMKLRLKEGELIKVAKAISSKTRQKILEVLTKSPMDVSAIAKELNQTEANISAQIAILQKVGLVSCKYEPGNHGVRKICQVVFHRIEIDLF